MRGQSLARPDQMRTDTPGDRSVRAVDTSAVWSVVTINMQRWPVMRVLVLRIDYGVAGIRRCVRVNIINTGH